VKTPEAMAIPRLYRERTGPPLLLLHALGMERSLWQFVTAHLPGEILTCDLPGHGQAPTPAAGWSLADHAAALAAALEREGVTRIAVGGFSIGGLIAQQLAATRPDLVSRLILISTTHCYTDEQRALWAGLARLVRGSSVARFSDQLMGRWFTPEAIADDTPAVAYVRGCYATVPAEGFAQACDVLATADLSDLTARLRMPTLIICGDDDVPSFGEAARRFAATIPQSRLVLIPGGRHAACLEFPGLFTTAVTEFLGRLDGSCHGELG